MKLTKDQRFTAYNILLQEIEDGVVKYGGILYPKNDLFGGCWGLCKLIYDVFNIDLEEMPRYKFIKIFPELYKYKTKEIYWFKNWEERKQAIIDCINQTK